MPTYDYRCAKCGEDLEVYQSFAEAPLTKHEGCGGKLTKVMSPAGIVLKGSGFYKTDNRESSKRSSSKESAAQKDSGAKDSGSKDSGGSSSSGSTPSNGKGGSEGSSGSGSKQSDSGSGTGGSTSSSDAKKPAAKSA